MKSYLAVAACAALAACGGSGGSSSGGGAQNHGIMGVNIPGGVKYRTFTANAASAEYDPADPNFQGAVSSYQASLKFLSSTQAELTAFGNTVPLTYDSMLDSFVDTSGAWQVTIHNSINGEPATQNMFYVVIRYDDGSAPAYRDVFVHGNRTAAAAMPTTGIATYSGLVDVTDGQGRSPVGSFTLDADFGNSQVGGVFTGIVPANASLSFVMSPVAISGNAFAALTGDLTSVDPSVTVNSGSVNGRFFGPTAGEVGGTLLIDTSAGNGAGMFGGPAQP